jgi:hypothetical protein
VSMAGKGWSKRFDEPIVLDDGTTLATLREAVEYLAKTVPKAEHHHPSVLNASDHLTRSAEQNYQCSLPERQRCRPSTEIENGSSIRIAKTITGSSES